MKIILLSSLARDTGCFLRGKYLAASLRSMADVHYIPPFPRSLPYKGDLVVSVLINVLRVFFSRADIYIGLKPFPNVTLPLLLIKWIKKKKIVVDIDDRDAGYGEGLVPRLGLFFQKPFPQYFDLVTYHNDLLASYITTTFGVDPERLYQLEQGVDLHVFSPDCYDGDLRRMFPADTKIVLYCGHLNIAADLEPILEAMKIVQTKVNCTFIAAGGGPAEKFFRQQAQASGVTACFTGRLSSERVASFMAMADVCLVYYRDVPVNHYRCSMKVREYLAMGRKVVADDVGDLRNFRAWTWQTSPDTNDYAEKIREVLTRPTDRREMAGAEYIRDRLNWEDIGKKFYKRLQGL